MLVFNKQNIIWLIVLITGAVLAVTYRNVLQEVFWRSMLVNFTFFVSLAGGMVVWPAIIEMSNGGWSKSIDNRAFSGITFAIPSLLVLVVLWLSSPGWAPWHNKNLEQGFWLNNSFLFLRDIIALLIFWTYSFIYIKKRMTGNSRMFAGILILIYCVVFSLLGFDLVMSLDNKWSSTLFGGYFFISGLYIAVVAWTLAAIVSGENNKSTFHDLGKLIVTFSVLTAYLLLSQLLPMWYENLPSETRNMVHRMNYSDWSIVSFILLVIVYLGPVVFLLTEQAKKTKWYLASVSILILAGMWLERMWLIEAVFTRSIQFGFSELGLTLVFLSLVTIGMGSKLHLTKDNG